jgi:aspartyl-tRNA(Asn)/glutamyl-tRNA(Gln) amidotransferase subunit C
MRADELTPCLPHDEAMQNAPQTDGTFFKVPKVIER